MVVHVRGGGGKDRKRRPHMYDFFTSQRLGLAQWRFESTAGTRIIWQHGFFHQVSRPCFIADTINFSNGKKGSSCDPKKTLSDDPWKSSPVCGQVSDFWVGPLHCILDCMINKYIYKYSIHIISVKCICKSICLSLSIYPINSYQ